MQTTWAWRKHALNGKLPSLEHIELSIIFFHYNITEHFYLLKWRSLTPLLPLRLLANVVSGSSWRCRVPGKFIAVVVVSSNGRVTISSRWFVLGLLMTVGWCDAVSWWDDAGGCLLTFTWWLVLAELDAVPNWPPPLLLCLGIAPVFLLHRPAWGWPSSTVAFAVITPEFRLWCPCCCRGWWPDWWPPFFVFDCPICTT